MLRAVAFCMRVFVKCKSGGSVAVEGNVVDMCLFGTSHPILIIILRNHFL